MKRVYVYMAIGIFTITLFFSLNLNAADESGAAYPESITGQVISVGQGTFTVEEDKTQTEYTISGPRDKLKDIKTVYRVEVKAAADGTVSSLTILGMPMQDEPDPEQKWKVITYPGAGPAVILAPGPAVSPAIKPAPSPATNPAIVKSSTTYPETIVGQITSIGHGTFTVEEDKTQTEYTISGPRDKLKDIKTGYRVEVKTTESGMVSSLTILGMPMQDEPDPEQRWKIITYPEAGPAPIPPTNP